MEADFSGYATKAGLECSDGRTIAPDAFKHMDGMSVPLVWAHGHKEVGNVLGHAILENRPDGVYSYAFFNETKNGQDAKTMVQHKDLKYLSIWANQLKQRSALVVHGMIREVSLVLAGANPGAVIDAVKIAHSEFDIEDLPDEVIIHSGLEVVLGGTVPGGELEHAVSDGDSIKDIYNSMSDDQQGVVQYLVAAALEGQGEAKHSETPVEEVPPVVEKPQDNNDEGAALSHQEGPVVTKNLFDTKGEDGKIVKGVLAHDDVKAIFADAARMGSMKTALEAAIVKHGIENMELMFPDAKALTDRPEFDKRRTEWVSSVLTGVNRTPFAKIKTLTANLNFDEARAKGYIKGTLKKEEFFPIATRSTGPATIYKKQKLDRDDIIDVTDFDMVAWLWTEIRLMLEEEIARAILIGDGRSVMDEDKIKDPAGAAAGDGIRSILHDHDYYAQTINFNLGSTPDYLKFIDGVIQSRRYYKGSGNPVLFTTEVHLAKMLTLRNGDENRHFRTLEELASELRVSAIIPVEAMESEPNVIGILVNLRDYNVGTNRGGEITTFDDFDIDYNQYKYLMETRLSGALTRVKAALVFMMVASGDVLVVPNVPTFVPATGVITIVATTGITYKNKATGVTLATGAQTALAAGATMTVVATSNSGYYQADNINDEWDFTRDAA